MKGSPNPRRDHPPPSDKDIATVITMRRTGYMVKDIQARFPSLGAGVIKKILDDATYKPKDKAP